jgi:hypothetical protein
MNPAFMVVANQSFPFNLYDLHLEGLTAKELATAYSIPVFRVEEHLEAVRLSIKYQVKLSMGQKQTAKPLAARAEADQVIRCDSAARERYGPAFNL